MCVCVCRGGPGFGVGKKRNLLACKPQPPGCKPNEVRVGSLGKAGCVMKPPFGNRRRNGREEGCGRVKRPSQSQIGFRTGLGKGGPKVASARSSGSGC
jgi:hypothetical protein